MNLVSEIRSKIETGAIIGGVIGLGYVGLPLVSSMARNGVKAIGFDIDPAKAGMLNSGKSYLETVSDEEISYALEKGLFEATADMSRLKEADFLIICVPTPLDEHKTPDLSYVEDTSRTIATYLRRGHVVSLESTTYPGTMEEVVKPILEQSGLKDAEDFYVIYSPEREDPGNKDFKTHSIPKVVGADQPEALELAMRFYGKFIDTVVPVRNAKTAEAVKITENIFRAVNIALVNELKVIYDRMGIDVWEVIEAAKTKPFGYMPFYPGPGLGGHCIPIDPFYLSWKAQEYDMPTRFIELAGEINISMPRYVLEKTAWALNHHASKALNGSRLLMLGVAYKKNVNDQRESPAFPLIRLLEEQGARVDFHDPHIPEILPTRHFAELGGRKSVERDSLDIAAYDAVLVVTDHDAIDYALVAESAKLIIDSRNVMARFPDVAKKTVKA
ncbi:MAG: nucleotide sugar dehydrogenase [Alphaproteobacteria bacterium]|nr:nucleotide sugar dehydrogenase [Alphaproteobacteria bacterium]